MFATKNPHFKTNSFNRITSYFIAHSKNARFLCDMQKKRFNNLQQDTKNCNKKFTSK